jgi:hypothetical protein
MKIGPQETLAKPITVLGVGRVCTGCLVGYDRGATWKI